MRHIVISMDVFAALWAKRRAGENSENAILERMLGLPKGPPLPVQAVGLIRQQVRIGHGDGEGGIHNRMFDVRFPQGFEIFRAYKGKNYSAVVREGRWIMDGAAYPSLFALSMAISDSNENPWAHWKFRDAAGRPRLISALRNKPHDVPAEKPAKRKAAKKTKPTR